MPHQRPSRALRGLALLCVGALTLAVALTLAATRFAQPSASDLWQRSDPAPSAAALPALEAQLPDPFGARPDSRLDPGWVVSPQLLDGVFLAPREHPDGGLEYLAVDATGRVLWTALRPPSCTGFTLSRTASGRGIAVLTDQRPSATRISEPVAAAFDLRSGAPVWGPTPVTGPFKGPGLVFAAAPDAFLGDVGEKVALDPSTGTPLLRETELHGERLLAEHRGTLVTITEAQLIARADGAVAWTLPLADRRWDAAHIANFTRQHRLGADVLVIPTPTPAEPDRTAHVDLRTGTLRAEPADATAATLRVTDDSGAFAEPLGPRWIFTPRT